jgi:hypothetical protein
MSPRTNPAGPVSRIRQLRIQLFRHCPPPPTTFTTTTTLPPLPILPNLGISASGCSQLFSNSSEPLRPLAGVVYSIRTFPAVYAIRHNFIQSTSQKQYHLFLALFPISLSFLTTFFKSPANLASHHSLSIHTTNDIYQISVV